MALSRSPLLKTSFLGQSNDQSKCCVSRVKNMREAAHLNMAKKQEKVKCLVDLRWRVVKDFDPGELVLVRRKLKKKNRTKKLLPKYVGPFQVAKKVCHTTYLVEDLPARRKKKRFRSFHIKFHPREVVEWDDWPDEPEELNAIQPSQGQPAVLRIHRNVSSTTNHRSTHTSTNRSAGSSSSPTNNESQTKKCSPMLDG